MYLFAKSHFLMAQIDLPQWKNGSISYVPYGRRLDWLEIFPIIGMVAFNLMFYNLIYHT